MISVTGNVSQKKFRPNLEKIYPNGTNKTTVHITVKAELFRLFLLLGKTQGKSVKLP